MQTSTLLAALLMGLVGGPHCLAMCGAACAGISHTAGAHSTRALWVFQLSRLLGYSLLGALAAGSAQGIAWLSTHTAPLRPLWSIFHVGAALLGLTLLWQARQPACIDHLAQTIWHKARPALRTCGPATPALLGALWALMPCGLLYAALLLAALSPSPRQGATTMLLFGLGTTLSLSAGPWLLLRLRTNPTGAWGIRLAGAALTATSTWALWMGLQHGAPITCT